MKPRRVMVVYAGWLGDLVWIVPALHALKTAFDSISLVVSEVQAPLAEIMRNGLVDKIDVDVSARRMATARRVRRAARTEGIDTFIDLKGRGKTGIYMPWGRGLKILIPHRRDAREYALARLLQVAVPRSNPRGRRTTCGQRGIAHWPMRRPEPRLRAVQQDLARGQLPTPGRDPDP